MRAFSTCLLLAVNTSLLIGCSGRVVTLTSSLHRLVAGLNLDDIMCERAYELFDNYAKSKLANLLFTRELQRR